MPRPRGRSNRPYPPYSLVTALQVAEAITEKNASHPMNRLLLAEAMSYSPSSSAFRQRVAASAKYGLTEGNFHSETISLTSLGDAATRPRNVAERSEARRNAFRKIPLFDELIQHYTNAKLPEPEFLKNVLEREPFNIDPTWSASAAEAFIEDASEVGYLRLISGSPHIVLDASGTTTGVVSHSDGRVDEADSMPQNQAASDTGGDSSISGSTGDLQQSRQDSGVRDIPMQIFIAHGKNRKPLEQLKEILNSWKVPFMVAVDEANAGRPISEKVADTMRQCSAGIFIFTSDEHFRDDAGTMVSRPSQNVVYELGAASLLYGRKIVILKESDVTFPSDFSDLGWIKFDKDALDAKAMDLLREMIALDAVRLVSAGSG